MKCSVGTGEMSKILICREKWKRKKIRVFVLKGCIKINHAQYHVSTETFAWSKSLFC